MQHESQPFTNAKPRTRQVVLPQQKWDRLYANLSFVVASKKDPVRAWIERHVPAGAGSCLELGCFPGRYLSVFGKLGYEVNGIDLTPRVKPDLQEWMCELGLRVGEFIRGDAFSHPWCRKYDVVCSFGLIEHFSRWADLVQRHAELVAENGMLLLATPNFRGAVQRRLHLLLDRQNFKEHNIDAMVPYQWARLVEPMGFTIFECGYFGRWDFWAGDNQSHSYVQRFISKLLRKSIPWLCWLPDGLPIYAPYCGLVAQKNG